MSEMTPKELTAYLKCAAELETSIYRQEAAKERANSSLRFQPPRKKTVSRPVNEAKSITPPVKYDGQQLKLNIFCAYFLIVFSLFFFGVGAFCSSFDYLFTIGIVCALIGVAVVLGGIVMLTINKKKQAAAELAFTTNMAAYEEQVEAAQKTYEQALLIYNEDEARAQQEYDEQYALARRNFDAAKEQILKLDIPMEESKQLLDRLYSADIIFPKYRDMVAMCTIYEYFAAGRCTELTGPDGAYNLYESELRQNLIINRWDTIISQLEDIKQNQYMLYQEMKQTNQILHGIASDIHEILNSTREIAEASKITAYCAQVTAQNTEALKYIALVSK